MAVGKLVFLVLAGVMVTSVYGDKDKFFCYDRMQCDAAHPLTLDQKECTAEWGAFPRVNGDASELIAQQLKSSFEYMLIASHFKHWKDHRPGFAKYFTKLSDENWNEAISLMTHVVERGGNLVEGFEIRMSAPSDKPAEEESRTYQLKEIEALGKALDMERKIATKTLHVAHLANHGQGVPHDSEFAEFLAQKLHKNSVLRIKHLANYAKLLSDIINDLTVDSAYALFKFDSEYLK